MRAADEDPQPLPGAPATGNAGAARVGVRAGRDAYIAGRDIYVHSSPPQPEPRPASGKVWGNVPPRNPAFAGRDHLLRAVREALAAGSRRAAIQALHGMGGIGKTQIALEYVHRHVNDYDVVWWLNAENTGLLAEQFAALAVDLGISRPEAPLDSVRRTLLHDLHFRERWLLIFDNAANAASVSPWLPSGPGHVLITSRSDDWSELAVPVVVGVLVREESVSILRGRVEALSGADADMVAAAVGDLPLALGHAASYLAATRMPAAQYVTELRDRASDILDEGSTPSYPSSLAAITLLGLDRLHKLHEPSADLVRICAFLAPEPVPAEWLVTAVALLPGPLASSLADPSEQARLFARLNLSGLVRVEPAGLVMHRLTQAVIRAALHPDQASGIRLGAEAVITANVPADPEQPDAWPAYARLVLHILNLLVLNEGGSDTPGLRDAAMRCVWYLLHRGDARAGHSLAAFVYFRWRRQSDRDDHHVLSAADALAVAMRLRGEYAEARALSSDVLDRRREHFGADHHETLAAARNLAVHMRMLGDGRAARDLDEDTFARHRRILGDDHPRTLASAHSLAIHHHMAGEHRAAREINQDTLDRRKRILGTDHPDTLASASNLAANQHELGDYDAARELNADTLARRRRVLGDDHPDSLVSANNLAASLRGTGDYRAALNLDLDTLRRRIRVLGKTHADSQQSAINVDRDRSGLRPRRQVARLLTQRSPGLADDMRYLDFTLTLQQHHRSMVTKQVAARIEAEISAWTGPGTGKLECFRLPSRKHLARQHGVSRAVIRDAIKLLRGMPRHGRGDGYLFRKAYDSAKPSIYAAPKYTRPWLDSPNLPVPPPSESAEDVSLLAMAKLLIKVLAKTASQPSAPRGLDNMRQADMSRDTAKRIHAGLGVRDADDGAAR